MSNENLDVEEIKIKWFSMENQPEKGEIVLLKFENHYAYGYLFTPNRYDTKKKEWSPKKSKWMYLDGYQVITKDIISFGRLQLPLIHSSPEND